MVRYEAEARVLLLWPNTDEPQELKVLCPNFACRFKGGIAISPRQQFEGLIQSKQVRRLPGF